MDVIQAVQTGVYLLSLYTCIWVGTKLGRDDVIEALQLSGKIGLVEDVLIKAKLYKTEVTAVPPTDKSVGIPATRL